MKRAKKINVHAKNSHESHQEEGSLDDSEHEMISDASEQMNKDPFSINFQALIYIKFPRRQSFRRYYK